MFCRILKQYLSIFLFVYMPYFRPCKHTAEKSTVAALGMVEILIRNQNIFFASVKFLARAEICFATYYERCYFRFSKENEL